MIVLTVILFTSTTQVLAQMPTISDATNEYWYMVKWNKSTSWYREATTVAGTANAVGLTTNAILSRAKLFKVTGTADNYQFFSSLNAKLRLALQIQMAIL